MRRWYRKLEGPGQWSLRPRRFQGNHHQARRPHLVGEDVVNPVFEEKPEGRASFGGQRREEVVDGFGVAGDEYVIGFVAPECACMECCGEAEISANAITDAAAIAVPRVPRVRLRNIDSPDLSDGRQCSDAGKCGHRRRCRRHGRPAKDEQSEEHEQNGRVHVIREQHQIAFAADELAIQDQRRYGVRDDGAGRNASQRTDGDVFGRDQIKRRHDEHEMLDPGNRGEQVRQDEHGADLEQPGWIVFTGVQDALTTSGPRRASTLRPTQSFGQRSAVNSDWF